MEELGLYFVILTIIILIFILSPILIFNLILYLSYRWAFNVEKATFKSLIKKSWLNFLLLILTLLGCSLTLSSISDELPKRVFVSIGSALAAGLINFFLVRKIKPQEFRQKVLTCKAYHLFNSISVFLISVFFYLSYPNEIIQLKSIDSFKDEVNHVSACNEKLNRINKFLLSHEGLLFAEFNKSDELIVVVKKINEKDKKILSKYSFNKITDEYVKSNYIPIQGKEIKDPKETLDINSVKTDRIGKSIIHSYSSLSPGFIIDLKSSLHHNESMGLKCPYYLDHYANVDFIYDHKNGFLLAIQRIGFDGP